MLIMNTIGNRIKAVCDTYCDSQVDFAERLSQQPTAVNHWIMGRKTPSCINLGQILIAFPKVNARWLITGKGK